MMTQVDEIEKGRHCEASTIEFMEMVCRAAEEASFPPPPTQDDNGEWVESDMNERLKKSQPLHVKLMNMLPTLIHNCCERKFMFQRKTPRLEGLNRFM